MARNYWAIAGSGEWVEAMEGRCLLSAYNHMGTSGAGFPIGESVTYRETYGGASQTYTQKISAYSRTINGYPVFKVTSPSRPGSAQYYSFIAGFGEVQVAEDSRVFSSDGAGTERNLFYPVKPSARSWEGLEAKAGETDLSSLDRDREVITQLGRQTVTVPAGTFANAIKIHLTSYTVGFNGDGTENPDDEPFKATVWLDAINGFVVKAQTDDRIDTKVLLSYKRANGGGAAPRVPAQRPDLMGSISDNSLPGRIESFSGQGGTVGIRLANNGAGAVGAGAPPITVTVFARPFDFGEDRVIGTSQPLQLGGLRPGQTRTASISVLADLPAGDYLIGIQVNPSGGLAESARFNNVFVGSKVITVVDGAT